MLGATRAVNYLARRLEVLGEKNVVMLAILLDGLACALACTHRCDIVRCDIVRCDIVHADTVEAA